MKRVLCLLYVMLLVACSSATTGEKTMSDVKQNKIPNQIIVMKSNNTNDSKTIKNELEMQVIVQILTYAKIRDVNIELKQPQYIVQVYNSSNEETYHVWFNKEEKTGYAKKVGEENKLISLSNEEAEKLIELFSFNPSLPGVSGGQESLPVGKNDFQITRFIIQARQQSQSITYKVTYRISDTLYDDLYAQQTYYIQLIFPQKVQNIIGMRESGAVLGESMKEGQKEYNVQIDVPAQQITQSQKQAISLYYDNYDLVLMDKDYKPKGIFHNIIQIVKQYGAKMDLQP
ncbi:hypothetical protein [Ectobacillus sp. sgz5001026]|uniref:hypothetical protein n=1 Tax=Ectobacillus sp. sgz5001026 TaxID=3242473 RepID=UPI0036D372F3